MLLLIGPRGGSARCDDATRPTVQRRAPRRNSKRATAEVREKKKLRLARLVYYLRPSASATCFSTSATKLRKQKLEAKEWLEGHSFGSSIFLRRRHLAQASTSARSEKSSMFAHFISPTTCASPVCPPERSLARLLASHTCKCGAKNSGQPGGHFARDANQSSSLCQIISAR